MAELTQSSVTEMDNKSSENYIPRLISEVEKRPLLWNRYHEYHHSRYLAEKGWEEVATALDRHKDAIRSKWKNLKDTFKRELRKIRQIDDQQVYTGRWRYFNRISFLKESYADIEPEKFRINNTKQADEKNSPKLIAKYDDLVTKPYNIFDYQFIKEEVEECDDVIIEEITFEAPNVNGKTTSSGTKRRASEVSLTEVENEVNKVRCLAVDQSIDLNEDLHFALSLVPYFKQLKSLKKLQVRSKIQTILYNALAEDD